MTHFELVTLKGVKVREDVYEVLLPTPEGIIGVFANHAPLVSTTTNGIVSVRLESNHPDDMLEHYAVNAGGVIEIGNDTVRVLVDEADNSKDIDEKEATLAYEHAKKLASEARDQKSLDEAMSSLDRQAVRLQVANLKRRKTH